jgi:hypothetical protein
LKRPRWFVRKSLYSTGWVAIPPQAEAGIYFQAWEDAIAFAFDQIKAAAVGAVCLLALSPLLAVLIFGGEN